MNFASAQGTGPGPALGERAALRPAQSDSDALSLHVQAYTPHRAWQSAALALSRSVASS